MKINMKSIFVALAIMLVCLVAASGVKAVPRPEAIRWKSSPTGFITSLYVGVLGRRPESRAVVAGWARRVTRRPGSRLSIFYSFIRSPEYKGSSWARQKREYFVYRRNNRNRTKSYTVSKGPLRAEWRVVAGRYTFGMATATRNFYQSFYSR